MKKIFTLKSCSLAVFVIVFTSSMALRAYWQLTRLDWAYWLSNIMMGLLLVVAGSSVSVALIVRPQFAFEQVPREIGGARFRF